MKDRLLGVAGFAAAVVIYVYYTAWVIVTPFVDPKVEWFHNLFPDRFYALAIPTALLLLGLSVNGSFNGIVRLRQKKNS